MIVEEVKANPDDTKLLQLHQKFKTDPLFIESTLDFIKKLKTHFKSKQKQEMGWTGYAKDMHNLFTQHIGKVTSKNKSFDINNETKDDYFLYLLKVTNETGLFVWKIFEDWRQSGCKTLQDMNKYWKVTINLERIDETMGEVLKIDYEDMHNKTFNAVLKDLKMQNFWQPANDSEIKKKQSTSKTSISPFYFTQNQKYVLRARRL